MVDTKDQSPIAAATDVPTMADRKDGNDKDITTIERVMSPDTEHEKDFMNYERVDAEVAKYATVTGITISPDENKRLKRLIDRRVLSIMIFTYFLQALDKGTLSFAAIMGIKDEWGLRGNQYSWLTTCIYIAILIIEYPTNLLVQRLPIAKYLGVSIICWGSILALHASVRNFPGAVAVRTLLGMFEAVCQPAFLILSSMWYKREEQAATVTYWYMMNGAQQIVGGLLAYCFSLIPKDSPIKSWQSLFMTYGVLSVFWGVFVLLWLPDSPMKAKCFSEEDKQLMVERVRSNQTGLQNKEWKRYQFIEALKDPQIYCYGLIQICTTLPTSGLGAFANIIITGFGFTVLQTQLLAMVLGAFIIIVLLSSTWLVKKTGQNCLVMGCYVFPSIAGTIVLMTVRNDHSTAREAGLLLSYYLCLSFWAAQTLAMSMVSRNVAGQSKKAFAVAFNFICWAGGNAAGAQVFLAWDAPRYFIAFATHMGCYAVLICTIIFLRFWLRAQNKKKDLVTGELSTDNKEGAVHGFEDLTDQENVNFRYIY